MAEPEEVEGGFVKLTPENRMRQMWEQIGERQEHLARLVGYNPLDSFRRSEVAFVAAFDVLLSLVEEVGASGVEFDDSRIGYVVVQIDRDVWTRCRAALTAAQGGDDG